MVNQSFLQGKRVLVTGATGFVGRNFTPLLKETGCKLIVSSRNDYDLLEQDQVRKLVSDTQPEIVFHLAGLSAGIMANRKYPADFFYQNLAMNTLLMHEAWKAGVGKYVTLIGGCSYPDNAPSPISETELWKGYPQEDSAPYSLAKAMNVIQAQSYRRQHDFDAIVLVPGNMYGPHDNYDLDHSHVIPATIRKFYEAEKRDDKEIIAWGTGKPVRDFIYVGDACESILLAAEAYSGEDIINISSGQRVPIRELVETVAELTGYQGRIQWDTSKPDGQLYKGYDVTRMHEWLGYQAPTSLREGLEKTIAWFDKNYESARLDVPIES